MRNALIFVSMAVLLSGCETMQQQTDPYADFHPELGRVMARCDARMPAEVKASLGGKLPLTSEDKRTMLMLANLERAVESEKPAMIQYAELRERCRAEYLAVHDRYGFTGISSIWRSGYSAADGVFADLYNGAISYGEANKQLAQISSKSLQAVQDYASAMDARQTQLAEQQRLEVIQMMQTWQARRPTAPPTTTCTTSRIGNQLRTVCN